MSVRHACCTVGAVALGFFFFRCFHDTVIVWRYKLKVSSAFDRWHSAAKDATFKFLLTLSALVRCLQLFSVVVQFNSIDSFNIEKKMCTTVLL